MVRVLVFKKLACKDTWIFPGKNFRTCLCQKWYANVYKYYRRKCRKNSDFYL